MPFSAKELEQYTCPECILSDPFRHTLAAKWHKAKMGQKKILVVDDEPVVCSSVRKILSRHGYLVEGSYSGQEALQRIEQNSYELVILDLVMPEISGIEVLKMIKERWPEIKVIVITGYASVNSAIESIRKGAEEYVPKPFTPSELVTAVVSTVEA